MTTAKNDEAPALKADEPTVTIPGRSLHRKLAQVMHEVGRIPKNGRAPAAMGGYKFVQVGDATDAIRKALADVLLTMVPVAIQVVGQVDRPTKSGGSMTTVDIITTWRITDAESGEFIDIQSFGAGADGGDKYSGKASTSAMKYALLTGFMLSTGDDTEASNLDEQVGPGSRPAPPRLPPREDPATVDPAPSSEPYSEREELIGRERRRGIIRKGSAAGYQLEPRPGPDGYVVGFRLETSKGNIPQCIVSGELGDSLMLATNGKPETLLGTPATVAGILYYVRTNRDQSWYRLKVDRFENADWVLPPDPDGAPIEAPTTPLFDDIALPEPPPDVELVGEKGAA